MKKLYAVFVYEFRETFHKSKILLVMFFIVILYESTLSTIQSLCNTTGLTVGVFEPFILICSKNINIILIPIIYILVISGFPYCKVNYFHISRVGKKFWLCGELLFIIAFTFLLTFVLAVGTVLPIIENTTPLTNDWSIFMLDFKSRFPELFMKNTIHCLDTSYTLHGTPIFEGLYCFSVTWFNLSIIGVLILLGSVCGRQILFMVIAASGVFVGGCSTFFEGNLKWIFPIAHMQYGLHFNTIFSGNNFPVSGTFIYLGIILLAEIITCSILLNKIKSF